MQKIILFLTMVSITVWADYQADISTITPEIKQRMIKGNSYRKGCPVGLDDLRYLRLTHKNFSGKEQWGELIVHREVADELVKIFEALYKADYPIYRMRLVSDYNGNDWQSIEADNTSAFNCRRATGSRNWSRHSYGKAIDINPIENPYISRSGHISHKASLVYRKRMHRNDSAADRAVLLPEDRAVKIFKEYGWQWGGDWSGVKDYQHFQK
ncbi:MAG: M15 family metallopeptidase [Sulfurovum sp.]|nr:M15 family metallopeptidase [Sulfurovum sp.]